MALVLKYSGIPPLASIAASSFSTLSLSLLNETDATQESSPVLIFPSGDELFGNLTILRYFGRVSSIVHLYGNNPLEASQIDQWLEYSSLLSNGAAFESLLTFLNNVFENRTFLVGYDFSIADMAIWFALAGTGARWDNLAKSSSNRFCHVARWHTAMSSDHPILSQTLNTQTPSAKQTPQLKKDAKPRGPDQAKASKADKADKRVEGPADLALPDAKQGEVVTRFPPEPSGYLHIGHAKAALMNKHFAEKYGGKLIIRFDDTNPSKEKDEFVDNILADLATLGVEGDRITYTSDYFDDLLAMCVRMIKEGKAYVDDTPKEKMREERMEGIESVNRNNSVEKNMLMWQEMLAGTPAGQSCCVRGKLDMTAVNKSLRDPVYMRCNLTAHHRTGSKYKVYPTYDFACPYVDSVEGITHALRSSEYHDRNEQYYRVLEDMGLRKVHVCDFSRLNFQYTLLSKRKLLWFVENGRVEGWSDPRFPTVQGIIRRGLTVEALKQFILSQGASRNLNLMEWDKLWTLNKKIIDPVCPRHTAIVTEKKVSFLLRNGPEASFVRILPKHKKHEPAGKKATIFSKRIWMDQADAMVVKEGEEVTLMDWGNAIVEKIVKDEQGDGSVLALEGRLHLEGSVKMTKWKLTWLADSDELVPLSLVELDHLITKKKLEEDDDFTKALNPKTRWEVAAMGDSNIRNLKKGEILQLERKGYFICDVPYIRPSRPAVLISIPDGRQKNLPGNEASGQSK